MHSNGIAYDIIKKKLPVINEEIAKVLANIVEFEVFFNDDGKRLNIFIKHPNHDARPLKWDLEQKRQLQPWQFD